MINKTKTIPIDQARQESTKAPVGMKVVLQQLHLVMLAIIPKAIIFQRQILVDPLMSQQE